MAAPAVAHQKLRKLHELPLSELVRAVGASQVSGSDVAQHFLQRIAQINPSVNAVVEVKKEAPAEKDEVRDGSLQLHPLLGVPFLVKDSLNVEGFHTVCGSTAYSRRPPASRHASIVALLYKLGAVPIGKTNLPPLSIDVQTYNEVHGVTQNPYRPGVTCGGSSGGSGAAVAAGMAPLAVGSDWGGSLRIPAAFCGVCSMRASKGRMTIDGKDGILPPMPLQAEETGEAYVSGIFTRFVTDLRYAMSAIFEANQATRSRRKEPLPQSSSSAIAAAHIIVTPELPGVPIQSEMKVAFEELPQRLSEVADATDTTASDRAFQSSSRDQRWNFTGEVVAAPALDWKGLDKANKAFTAGWNWKGERELQFRRQQAASAREVQLKQAEIVESFFAQTQASAWVVPVTGVLPFKHNPSHSNFTVNGSSFPYWRPLRGYVVPFSMTGHPVVTMHLKMIDGLPCGMQVVGKLGMDEELLDLCVGLERVLGRPPPPAIFGEIRSAL